MSTTTNYYAPAATHLDRPEKIAAAYARAGLAAPNNHGPILEALHASPSVSDVAAELAREAVTREDVTDTDAWIAQAAERIREAQAVEALRDEVAMAIPVVVETQLPTMVDRAAHDLAKHVAAVAKALGKAAEALPAQGDPFDLEAIVALDATKEMRAAQAALSELAVYASVHTQPHPSGSLSPALARLLPLVELPEVAVERRRMTIGGHGDTLNESAISGSRAVRVLARLADRDGVDRALCDVARGRWEGIRIRLAGWGEMSERVEAVHVAHAVEQVEGGRGARARVLA